MSTAIVDNGVFALLYLTTHQIFYSQVIARVLSVCVNWTLVKFVVFAARDAKRSFPKFAALAMVNVLVTYTMIRLFKRYLGITPIYAKLIFETCLFLFNFSVQRFLIFRHRTTHQP